MNLLQLSAHPGTMEILREMQDLEPASHNEIARRMADREPSLSRSTTHRILKGLVEHGVVHQTQQAWIKLSVLNRYHPWITMVVEPYQNVLNAPGAEILPRLTRMFRFMEQEAPSARILVRPEIGSKHLDLLAVGRQDEDLSLLTEAAAGVLQFLEQVEGWTSTSEVVSYRDSIRWPKDRTESYHQVYGRTSTSGF